MDRVVKHKVLILINEESPALAALSYLKQRDYELKIIHKLIDGVSELTHFKPDVLLMSWNLKNTDVKKVHAFITSKFKVICFVFGEENNMRSSSSLQASGLPNTIIPPLAGGNIHARIQTALKRERLSPRKELGEYKTRRMRDRTVLGGVEYARPKKSEIPKDLVWKVRIHSPHPENQIWETILYKNGQATYLYYKGVEPPAKWLEGTEDLPDNKHYVFKSATEATGDLLRQFQDYAETGYLPTDESKEESEEDLIREALEAAKSDLPTLLEKSLHEAVDLALAGGRESNEPVQQIGEVSNLVALMIRSAKFKGYLISGQADDLSNPEIMKKVFDFLTKEMREKGHPLFDMQDILEVTLSTISLKAFVDEKAQFFKEAVIGRNELIFAYLPADKLPNLFSEEEHNGIDIDFLEPEKAVKFDLFIHMPKNEKFIRYLKNGSVLSKEKREHLACFAVKTMFVKKRDEKSFLSYCATNHIGRASEIVALKIAR